MNEILLDERFHLEPIECWFLDVFTDDSQEETLKVWLADHPEFECWMQKWFDENFVSTGQVIYEECDMCHGGCTKLIFKTKEAALKYASREPLIASGKREIVRAIYIEWEKPDEDLEPDLFERFNEDPGEVR